MNANNYYALGYGLSIYDAMKDARLFREPMLQYAEKMDPDFIGLPVFYPLDALKIAAPGNVKWPGPDYNLPLDTPYQYIDEQYLDEDDYEMFLGDPSAFLQGRVFAEHYKGFSGVAGINWYSLCSGSPYSLAAFSAPPFKEALLRMIQAAAAHIPAPADRFE